MNIILALATFLSRQIQCLTNTGSYTPEYATLPHILF